MAKILIVEDDRGLAELISDWLAGENHTVETVWDGKEGQSRLTHYTYDLLIVDWNLPDVSGIQIIRKMRQDGLGTPTLMLTAKSSLDDKESGLDAGCDDYLTKPFEMRELSARVRALLRRVPTAYAEALVSGALTLNSTACRLTINGEEVRIQPLEFTLLEFFMRNQNRVFSLDALIQRVWGFSHDVSEDGVRSSIKRLRKVLGDSEGERIKNVHGLGYRFDSSS